MNAHFPIRLLLELVNPLLETAPQLSPEISNLDKMLYLEAKYFLADHNLNYTDKMAMAASLEVRERHRSSIWYLIQARCQALLWAPDIISPAPNDSDVTFDLDFRVGRLLASGFELSGDTVAEIDATLLLCRKTFGVH